MRFFLLASTLILSACLAKVSTHAAVIVLHDESVNGDLSDNSGGTNLAFPDPMPGGTPTQLGMLAPGSGGAIQQHRVTGTTDTGAGDFFTIEIGSGNQLREILFSFSGGDNALFAAISSGDIFANSYDDLNWDGGASFATFTGVPAGSNWLGGAVLNLSTNGTDVLDNLLGFADFNNLNLDAPLNEGKYSFLVQQTGPASSYTLDFGVATAIPEPSAFVLVGMLTLSFAGASRRRR